MPREFFEKVRMAFETTAKKAVRVSGDALDYTKIKLKITEINAKLDEKYMQIGMAVYERENSDDIDMICDEITALRQELDELKLKLTEYKNQKTCSVCGALCGKNDEFCRKCGNEF